MAQERYGRRDFLKLIPPFLSGVVGGMALTKDNSFHNIDIWERPLPIPDPDVYRFLLIADVHAGNTDVCARQNNTKSFDTLQSVTKHLKDYPLDRVIQMGDLIRRHGSEGQNIENFEKGVDILKQFPCPTIHLLGNHDVWGISPNSFSKIQKEHALKPYFGVEKFKGFQIVWFDMAAQEGSPGTLPEERIDWLRNKIVFKDTPTIIFSHYALLPQDPEGNYYFDGDPSLTALTNGQKVWESLKGLPVHAVISAHMHQITHSQVEETHMISVPAFVENMLSSDSNENPGVYSILEINYPKKIILKSYFGSICFSRIQII